MDISYHFHKIPLKCEIFSPTFTTREQDPISCFMRWEKECNSKADKKSANLDETCFRFDLKCRNTYDSWLKT